MLLRKQARNAVAVAILALVMAAVIPAHALAYNCVNGVNCYGIARWYGGTTGATTNLRVVPISDNDGPYFINDAQWLTNTDNTGCKDNICWVETGYMASGGSLYYYWADQIPGRPYLFRQLPAVPGAGWGINQGPPQTSNGGTWYADCGVAGPCS